ncbi:MAG TPA: 23S rRNA (uracil(1939)-C(5))-methyltransferase RlmD [Acidobacteriaceae bacterium]|nr:23S rRNA (uracil(1939)-C(5))-methyltransferase RlmD [Acidobacteriaceae bacterium]
MKLTIEKVVVGGQGLARVPAEVEEIGGMRAFVPFTLPGEIVEAELREQHHGYCTAFVRQIERASSFRTQPPCPWFGTCGGCQLQHGMYSHQLEIKREMLSEALRRAGVRELAAVASIAGEPLAYRNRIRLQVQTHPNFAIGYRHTKSHRITPIDHCPIAAPLLQQCIARFPGIAQQEMTYSTLQEVELFTNHDQTELLATFWVRPSGKFETERWRGFLKALQKQIPQLTGADVLAEEKTKTQTARPLLEWGQKSLRYSVGGRDYTVSRGSFFQTNLNVLHAFVEAAIEGDGGKLAWDLFAGAGLFSLALAGKFDEVVAVESSPSACRDFKINLREKNAALFRSSVLDFLQKAARQSPAPDLVLLDPPRAGLGVEGCGLLARCGPSRITYVSCDPATLGRDLAALIQSGYRLQQLQLVDMFPQTHHLETIARLYR